MQITSKFTIAIHIITAIDYFKDSEKVTSNFFFDVYKAVDCVSDEGLFHFHENPSTDCPVGRNIHKALDEELLSVQSSMEDQMRKIPLSVIVKNTRREILGEDD